MCILLEIVKNSFTKRYIAFVDIENKKIIKRTYLLRIFPYFLVNIFTKKRNHILVENNIYNYINYEEKFFINPIITLVQLKKKNKIIDITNKIKKYKNNFPLWLVLQNENFINYEKIIISKNKILNDITTEIDINKNSDKILYEIYKL